MFRFRPDPALPIGPWNRDNQALLKLPDGCLRFKVEEKPPLLVHVQKEDHKDHQRIQIVTPEIGDWSHCNIPRYFWDEKIFFTRKGERPLARLVFQYNFKTDEERLAVWEHLWPWWPWRWEGGSGGWWYWKDDWDCRFFPKNFTCDCWPHSSVMLSVDRDNLVRELSSSKDMCDKYHCRQKTVQIGNRLSGFLGQNLKSSSTGKIQHSRLSVA